MIILVFGVTNLKKNNLTIVHCKDLEKNHTLFVLKKKLPMNNKYHFIENGIFKFEPKINVKPRLKLRNIFGLK